MGSGLNTIRTSCIWRPLMLLTMFGAKRMVRNRHPPDSQEIETGGITRLREDSLETESALIKV